MTTYNASTVSNTAIASGKPITLQQGRALRDNPIASREGVNGAAYEASAWHPYNGVTIGDGNYGRFYGFAFDGAVSSFTTPTFEDGYEYQIHLVGISPSVNATLRYQPYLETSAAYDTVEDIVAITTGQTTTAILDVVWPRSRRTVKIVPIHGVNSHGGGFSLTGRHVTTEKFTNIKFTWDLGHTDAGMAYLYRRISYA